MTEFSDLPSSLIDTVWEALWFAVKRKIAKCQDKNERALLRGMLRFLEGDIEQ